jgi:hypothetical protein
MSGSRGILQYYNPYLPLVCLPVTPNQADASSAIGIQLQIRSRWSKPVGLCGLSTFQHNRQFYSKTYDPTGRVRKRQPDYSRRPSASSSHARRPSKRQYDRVSLGRPDSPTYNLPDSADGIFLPLPDFQLFSDNRRKAPGSSASSVRPQTDE